MRKKEIIMVFRKSLERENYQNITNWNSMRQRNTESYIHIFKKILTAHVKKNSGTKTDLKIGLNKLNSEQNYSQRLQNEEENKRKK